MNKRQINYLLSLANSIDAKYQIGKNEISENTLDLLDKGLKKNELIKIKVQKSVAEEKEELAHLLENELHAEVIKIIGNIIILFRKNLKEGKIHLPD